MVSIVSIVSIKLAICVVDFGIRVVSWAFVFVLWADVFVLWAFVLVLWPFPATVAVESLLQSLKSDSWPNCYSTTGSWPSCDSKNICCVISKL